jgi:hypothetical protein
VNCIIFYRMLRWWPCIWLCRPLQYMPQYFVITIWRKLCILMCWKLQRTSVSYLRFLKYNFQSPIYNLNIRFICWCTYSDVTVTHRKARR